MTRPLLLCVVLAAGCAEVKKQMRLGMSGTGSSYAPRQPDHPSGGAAAGAAIGSVGDAIGAAAMSRVTGGCIATCPPGTACNAQTGLCDTQPCRGSCGADEICQNERCVPLLLPGLNIHDSPKP
jgi:hypothetical protein